MIRKTTHVVHLLLAVLVTLVGLLPPTSPVYGGAPPPKDTSIQVALDTGHLDDAGQPPVPPEAPGPGWQMVSTDPVPPDEVPRILFGQKGTRVTAPSEVSQLPTSEAEITPEIEALARGLENDPKLIFEYVHNHVEYVPTFGSVNGATGTLLDGRGNDWDQVSLFIALMRAAGYTANYVAGVVEYEVSRLANWLGVAEDTLLVVMVLANGGVPLAVDPSGTRVQLIRVWAAAEIDGQAYWFDPAMKEYEHIEGINLGAALGYDREAFLANAATGAQVTDDFVRNINETNVRADLAAYSMNLVNYIVDNVPDASVAEVIGGRRIVPTELSAYPTVLPYALSVTDVQTGSEVADAFRHTLRVQHVGIDETLATFQLSGKRLTITYDSSQNDRAVLLVDGVVIATSDPTDFGDYYDLIVTVDHPYAALDGTYADQQRTFRLRSGDMYVLGHDFGDVSSRLIAQRRNLLLTSRAAGWDDTAEPVLGESLWLVGLTWLHQLNLVSKLLAQMGQVVMVPHHRIGLLGQESGYFMDQAMGVVSVNPAQADADVWPVFQIRALMGSALEHGVLEQLQGSDNSAVSTIKLLQISNGTGQRTFLAHAGNWATVRPQLRNYQNSQLNYFATLIGDGHQLVLPRDAHIRLNQWEGVGYIDSYQVGTSYWMSMMIEGGYSGGYSSEPGLYEVMEALEEYLTWTWGPDPNLWPDVLPEVETPQSGEPVDMATGAYVHTSTDLSLGPAEPLGLRFQRFYNSHGHYDSGVLGHGWAHNYEIHVAPSTHAGPALGLRTPVDAASIITWAYVVLDLAKTFPELDATVPAVLATKWAMDQLTDNALIVRVGLSVMAFIRLADGSYSPPPGMPMHLAEEGDGYLLQDPSGRLYAFDAEGRITRWQDRNGNTLTLSYDGEGRLQSVANGLGYSLTFAYTDGLLTSVTDMAGRSVAYEYTDGNLTAYHDAEGNVYRYEYDAANRLTALYRPKTPAQAIITNVYDDFDRVTTQTDALGNVFTFYFSGFRNVEKNPDGSRVVHYLDEQGHYIGREDALGHRIEMTYDGQWRLVAMTDRLGDTTQMTYHPQSGRLASYTDAEGNATTFTYTAQDQSFTILDSQFAIPQSTIRNPQSPVTFTFYNLTRITYPDGTHEDYAYDAQGNVLTRTDRLGKEWHNTYNERGQVLTITNPNGGVITYTYNADGTLASSTDTDLGITTYAYDAYKRLSTITYPGGATMHFTYDLNDRLLTLTDELGRVTTFTYDANGNPITARNPLSQTLTYAHDLMDHLTARTDPVGQVTNLSYDEMGRLETLTDRNGNATTYAYEARGWLTGITDPAGNTWTTTYDDEGVPTAFTTPLGYTTAFQTDKLGRTTVITDPLGQQADFAYDALGRLTSTTDSMGRTTTYDYDDAGRLVGVTRAGLGPVTYTRDDLGLLARITDLRGKHWDFGYSAMGRLTSHTDPLGRRWAYAYDERGRLQQITYPDGSSATYTYDAASQVTQIAYPGGPTLDFTYDDAGRLLAADGITLTRDARGDITDSRDGSVSFGASYDDGRRLKTVTYDGQATVTYTYDARNLLTRVEDDLSGAWMTFAYDDDGRLTQVQRSNGVSTTYTYDAAGRVTCIQDGALADQQYTLNAEGEPTQVARTLPLDPPLVAQVANLSYDDADQISAPGYAYDARGRQTAAPGKTFTYDGANRLTSVTASGSTATFTYNGLGDLRTRTVDGATAHYYHNYALGLNPIVAETVDLSGFVNLTGLAGYKRFYVYTPAGSLLYSIEPGSGAVRFYHSDRLGSTLFLTDGAGGVSDAYAYDPYGNLLDHSGTSDQPFTYVGAYGVRYEPVGGLYDMRARFYDPATARFLTRDPVWPVLTDLHSLSPYAYAAQSPLHYIDPLGTTWWERLLASLGIKVVTGETVPLGTVGMVLYPKEANVGADMPKPTPEMMDMLEQIKAEHAAFARAAAEQAYKEYKELMMGSLRMPVDSTSGPLWVRLSPSHRATEIESSRLLVTRLGHKYRVTQKGIYVYFPEPKFLPVFREKRWKISGLTGYWREYFFEFGQTRIFEFSQTHFSLGRPPLWQAGAECLESEREAPMKMPPFLEPGAHLAG